MWILIVTYLLYSGDPALYSPVVTFQEFNAQTTCVAAKNAIEADLQPRIKRLNKIIEARLQTGTLQGTAEQTLTLTCVQK